MAKLKAENLKKTYDDGETVAVDGLSFEVGEGEIVSLLGPSGCGKTTTLRCIAGVEQIDSGRIAIDDRVISSQDTSLPAQDRNLGMLYQNYAIWPHKTVFENVLFPLKHSNHRFDPDEYEDRVNEILELVQISQLRDKPATDLSGGQQQRTSLARALVHDPDLLLLDEPLSNLDRKLRVEMRDQIQQLQYELGVSILYVTHDQQEAFYLADNVLVLRDGQLVESGDPSDLYHQPHDAFTRDFVGDWNKIPGMLRNGSLSIDIGQSRLEIDSFDLGEVNVGSRNEQDPQEVECFIRPTSVRMADEDDGDDIHIEGTVVAEGVLGELYEFTVDTDLDQITVQVTTHLDLERGEEISLSIPPSAIKVYGG